MIATHFYDALAPLFDVMTDWDVRLAAEGPFLSAVLDQAGARTVLDAACGSGGHALWLARRGYGVTGADASPAMIDLARRKAEAANLTIPFIVADLTCLPPADGKQATPSGKPITTYDAVLCLGNSLPHLLSRAELVASLRGMAAVLRPGGLLVLQNLNYDLRWRVQPRWFAAQGGLLEGQEVLVWRFADYDTGAGRIAFHIALFRKGPTGWHVDVHTTPHRPVFEADLLGALAEAGFEGNQSLGRMSWPPEPFDSTASGDLVILAHQS